jgi:hypothetical protein
MKGRDITVFYSIIHHIYHGGHGGVLVQPHASAEPPANIIYHIINNISSLIILYHGGHGGGAARQRRAAVEPEPARSKIYRIMLSCYVIFVQLLPALAKEQARACARTPRLSRVLSRVCEIRAVSSVRARHETDYRKILYHITWTDIV